MSDWIIPYVVFDGNCEEAVSFYQQVLGGEVMTMHYGDAPPNLCSTDFTVPEQAKHLVLHAEFRHDGHVLRFCDNFPGSPFCQGNNIALSLEHATAAETRAMFDALSVGGKVDMPPQKTFFSPMYAKFTDKFGIIWHLHTKQ